LSTTGVLQTSLSGREFLEQWIDRSKLNQLEAAERIKIDPTQLNQILKGKRRPGLDNAILIERATGIPVEAWVPFEDGDNGDKIQDTPRKRKTGKA